MGAIPWKFHTETQVERQLQSTKYFFFLQTEQVCKAIVSNG